jgi:glycosyltransferase involved in cell wall biosynthesis
MAVYNGLSYLTESVDSILGQTLSDLELIAIDDCSTDGSFEVLEQYARRDPRVCVLRNSTNRGQIRSVNRGILEAKAPYVAIMDADDIAMPQRLEKQVTCLDEHPDVGIVGCLFLGFEHDVATAYPTSARADGSWLDGNIVMCHPTMVVRRELFALHGLYDARYEFACDYEMQSRFAHGGVTLHVLDEPLLYYRGHATSMSRSNPKAVVSAGLRVSFRTLFRYRRRLSQRGWRALARYMAVYVYLTLRLERVVPRTLAKELWPAR